MRVVPSAPYPNVNTPGHRPMTGALRSREFIRVCQAVRGYEALIRDWNNNRRDPDHLVHQQLHPCESDGYHDRRHELEGAVERLLMVEGLTPLHWEGRIFPEISIRREGDQVILEPAGWQPGTDFSRARLWRYILDDTIGIVSTMKGALEVFGDGLDFFYLYLHQAWGYRALARTGTRLVLEQTQNITPVGNETIIVGPSHDSGTEFGEVPAVLLDYGIRAYFMADKKFFDTRFWKPPAFGLLPLLLGPMELYGHLAIDRSDRRKAFDALEQVGSYMKETERSVIIFPQSTRTPVCYDEEGNRFEGRMYGAKPGIASILERWDFATLPIGLIGGAVVFPKQNGDAYLRRGAAVGRVVRMRFGPPFGKKDLGDLSGKALRQAFVGHTNRTFHELTGREVGPPAASKDKRLARTHQE